VANDANCFALSEAVDGAGAQPRTADQTAGLAGDPAASTGGLYPRVVFGVIVGTGTGGGIVVDGKILVGPNSIAGEWGHNPLPWMTPEESPGPPCYCGQQGCIETFLSGPGLARDHQRATGQALTAPAVVAAAEAGDSAAEATIVRYEDRMARALASVLNMLDPDVVVLGGGLSQVARLYENVPRQWGKYTFSDQVLTRLAPPRHGDASGVRGAAWLWTVAESREHDA
jgi:fructokinase